MKVLLVGSDREITHMTAKILSRNKHEVLTAVGFGEAAGAVKSKSFDIAVVDCGMTAEEQKTLISSVKKRPDSPPLLLISANGEDEIPLLQEGADDWIQKPYKMDVLLVRMEALHRNRK